MDDEVAIVAVALLVIYVGLLVMGIGSTVLRGVRYRRYHITMPSLLLRDVLVLGGHALPLVALLVLRIMDFVQFDFDRSGVNSYPIAWVIVLAPAVFAVAVYDYYEFFVIGG